MTQLRVGNRHLSFDAAAEWVTEYTSNAGGTYAYPAYDGYPGGGGCELTESDVLAPVLLNVQHLSLGAYYAVLGQRDRINEMLGQIPPVATLDRASDQQLELVAGLISLVEDRNMPGVQLTVLSKILHRLRPGLIPLYDENIERCYQGGPEPRVPRVRGRSWGDFGRAWLPEIRDDLVAHIEDWQALAALAPGPAITPLRALDIVGWSLGRAKEVDTR